MANKKRTIVLDFDGVIHSYTSGWQGPRTINDSPVSGAIDWIRNFVINYCDCPDSICAMAPPGKCILAIFSSRSRYFGGRSAMKKWLVKHGLDKRLLEVIKFPLFKIPAQVYVDDRAIQFNGEFPEPEKLIYFKPWNKK